MSDSDNNEPTNQMEEEEREREERNQIWACFMKYDVGQQGVMLTSDLKSALESLDERVSDTAVFRMISDADPNNLGTIQFSNFAQIVQEKRESEKETDDADLLDAYVAMGGDPDGGGCVDADKLIETIKKEFEMTIDIEKLIAQVDEDGSGEIEFDEFKELLAGAGGDGNEDGEDDEGEGGDD